MLRRWIFRNPPEDQGTPMRRLSFGVLLPALSTLVLELMLTRVFDVTLTPNLSYFVVSLAVFSFGLAGIYATLRRIPVEAEFRGRLVGCSVGLAVTALLLHPIINALPLDYTHLSKAPVQTIASFGALYLTLLVLFFLAGYTLIAIFSKYAAKIQRLYFWDLVGAGLGTVLVIPFILQIGPGGLIIIAAAGARGGAARGGGARGAARGGGGAAGGGAGGPGGRGRGD